MRESPRTRRLRNDRKALEKLRSESTIVDYDASGAPADRYIVRFYGNGLWRAEGSSKILIRKLHEVRIVLGASYPRMMPELTWVSPIFHPNISGSGVVCLGGYGTHWVPSLSLDELCEMLWDMIRYQNFDVDSPYNREAALWAKSQRDYQLPVDARPIRDRLSNALPTESVAAQTPQPAVWTRPRSSPLPDVLILDDRNEQIIEAELIDTEDEDIVFLD